MTFLQARELACRDGTPYPATWLRTRFPEVEATFNMIRRAWGSALVVTPNGGYRTVAYCRATGRSPTSQHVHGRAVDLRPARAGGVSAVLELHDLVLTLKRAGELPLLGGLGRYPGFVHIDTRPGRRASLARWSHGGMGGMGD